MPQPPNADEVSRRALGTPVYLGRITVAGNSKTNANTAVPFPSDPDAAGINSLEGRLLLLAASAAVDILPVAGSTDTCTATTGVPIDAAPGDRPQVTIRNGRKYLAVQGTGDVDVWELT